MSDYCGGSDINKRYVGKKYEVKAVAYLESLGYKIIEENFRCKVGEIDLIAINGSYLVFIEVKYRRSAINGSPLEAVDQRKQKVICRVADYYRLIHGMTDSMPCRFDVVGILGADITVIQDAFEYCGWQ